MTWKLFPEILGTDIPPPPPTGNQILKTPAYLNLKKKTFFTCSGLSPDAKNKYKG